MKLNFEKYRDKVQACWLGKNIGGTMGTPYEGKREILDINGFASKPGEPLPNDDLDLQLVWLYAMERMGEQSLNASVLADYWTHLIPPCWNEYGIGKANVRRGLMPPLSGDYNNDWKHSNGAWIRTEIWACLCPGRPSQAVKYAVEDAMVDHGSGEGTVAAAFVAAMQSAAFVVDNIHDAIKIGLAAIPENSRVAKSIALLYECKEKGLTAIEARNAIQQANADIGDGWFEAPSNVAYAVLGMLYGEGDFKKSMILAINCGDDTDCTGATVGSTLGILNGMKVIPEDWKEYIGDRIITVSIAMGICNSRIPKTCTELTERVAALAPKVLNVKSSYSVELVEGEESIPENIFDVIMKDVDLKHPLESLIPNSMRFDTPFFFITVVYDGKPEISPLEEKTVILKFENKHSARSNFGLSNPHNLTLRWLGCEKLRAESKTAVTLMHKTAHSQAVLELHVKVTAGESIDPINRIVLEIVNEGKAQITYVPITLLG